MPQSPILKEPVTFFLEIWDFDGDFLYAIDGDDQADINNGPGKPFSLTVTPGTSQIVTPGNENTVDVTVTLTITATRLSSSSGLRNLTVKHSPLIPVISDSVTFNANVFRDDLKITEAIEIWVADQEQIASRTESTAPTATCLGTIWTNRCEFQSDSLTAKAGRLGYKAVAYDLDGKRIETPWRLVDIVDASIFSRYEPPEPGIGVAFDGPLMAGVVSTQPFGKVRLETALDIVFHPGTGYDVTDRQGRERFFNQVSAHIGRLWAPPSTFLDHQQHVNFWVSPIMLPVEGSNPEDPDGTTNLCYTSLFDPLSLAFGNLLMPDFSAANGVIHTVDCRDNARTFGNNPYTANSPEVGWHELHHSAYGLADEYCCDSGYFQPNPYPNIYFWPDDCRADPLSDGNCQPIRSGGTALPGDATRWWRFGPTPNVMTNIWGEQQASHRRRASWIYERCGRGEC